MVSKVWTVEMFPQNMVYLSKVWEQATILCLFSHFSSYKQQETIIMSWFLSIQNYFAIFSNDQPSKWCTSWLLSPCWCRGLTCSRVIVEHLMGCHISLLLIMTPYWSGQYSNIIERERIKWTFWNVFRVIMMRRK